jgi:hypothetical protein
MIREMFTFKDKSVLNDMFKKSSYTFVATNLQFDICTLIREENKEYLLRPMIRGSRFIAADLVKPHNHGKVKCIDTLSFFPFGVKTLGQYIAGVNKIIPPAWLGRRPQKRHELKYLKIYCMRDAEISYKTMRFISEFCAELNINLKKTAAATALNFWRRNFLDRVIFQMKPELIEKHYLAYYGGRTELFRRGKIGDGYKFYDVNSLYPSVMRNAFPDPNSVRHVTNSEEKLIDEYEGISHARIIAPKYMKRPFLPYRHESGKLLFPLGEWDAWYSHVELRYAKSLGYKIKKVYETIYYTKKWYPFKKFVDFCYERRLRYKKEGNVPKEKFMKLLMNSLYGKFAQKSSGDQEIIHIDSLTVDKMDDMAYKGYEEDIVGEHGDWRYFTRKKTRSYPAFVIPILSLYTTAYARIVLYEYLKDDDSVVYVDTDSIVTKKNLKTSDRLGNMKLEYDLIDGCFVRPKFYHVSFRKDDKIVTKVKVKGTRIRDIEQFNKVIDDHAEVITERFATFKLCNRLFNGKYMTYNQIYKARKFLSLEDNKRIWAKGFDRHRLIGSRPLTIRDGAITNKRTHVLTKAEQEVYGNI